MNTICNGPKHRCDAAKLARFIRATKRHMRNKMHYGKLAPSKWREDEHGEHFMCNRVRTVNFNAGS